MMMHVRRTFNFNESALQAAVHINLEIILGQPQLKDCKRKRKRYINTCAHHCTHVVPILVVVIRLTVVVVAEVVVAVVEVNVTKSLSDPSSATTFSHWSGLHVCNTIRRYGFVKHSF